MSMLHKPQAQRLFVAPDIDLREFTIKDAKEYYELYNDPLVMPYIPSDMIPHSVDAAARQINELFLYPRSYPYWAIVDSRTDKVLGSCGFVSEDRYHKRIEIAYDLFPLHWGRGVIHKTLKVVLKYAFERLLVKRVEAIILPGNIRSEKVLYRIGFTYEGLLRSYKFFRNEMRDINFYSFVHDDYIKHFKN